MIENRVSDLKALIAAEYPHLEIVAQVEIASRGPCLIVASEATEALVAEPADLARWFGVRNTQPQVSKGAAIAKGQQTLLF